MKKNISLLLILAACKQEVPLETTQLEIAETVTETCVACVHICEHLHGRTDIQTALFSELSGRCERKLSLPPAQDSDFPETLRSVDPYKRLHLAMNLAAVR